MAGEAFPSDAPAQPVKPFSINPHERIRDSRGIALTFFYPPDDADESRAGQPRPAEEQPTIGTSVQIALSWQGWMRTVRDARLAARIITDLEVFPDEEGAQYRPANALVAGLIVRAVTAYVEHALALPDGTALNVKWPLFQVEQVLDRLGIEDDAAAAAETPDAAEA